MRRPGLFLLLLVPAALQIGLARQAGTILTFYPTADSITNYPTIDKKLEIVCEKKLSGRYVTFMGYSGQGKIFIAAVTLDSLKDPNTALSRTVVFNGIRPTLGQTTSWGYVFDRNGDGKIDYMALVEGAAAVEDDQITDDYPERGQHLTRPELELFVGHCKLIFDHWADDNFDGTIDAGIVNDADPKRDWIKQKIAVRSTRFDGRFDDAWAFRGSIDGSHDTIPFTAASVPYRSLGNLSDHLTKETLRSKTEILKLLNEAAAKCKVGPDVLSGE